ncbi:hypothetical protein Cni_G11086 [Canna indica]|uniref:Cystatin domain-containing protein n=1 Tax=Canna indica TaxID=4628 RepID=A0AAQ3K5P5_9LILI|nr:hypothetical protein Cni_G11086 [Canna indica]
MQTMGSELCISDSALIKAEVEEKGNGGDPGWKIDTEVEEENEDVNEEEKEDDDDDENDSLKRASEKLNEENLIREIGESDNLYLGDSTDSGTDSDDSDFENEEEKEAYRKYLEDFKSSSGFDIENYYRPPPHKIMYGLLSRIDPLEPDFAPNRCEEAIKNVLKFQNQKNNTTLQYVKIIKANGDGKGLFYVTFEAEDTISRTVKMTKTLVISEF